MTTTIINHLLQSTAFAAVCALLTLMFRNNRAHVRYALWMAASAKFLIPFEALIALGRTLGHWLLPATTGRQFAVVLEFVSQRTVDPAATRASVLDTAGSVTGSVIPVAILVVWAIGTAALLTRWVIRWWLLARLARRSAVITEGRELTILRRLEDARGRHRRVILLASDSAMEPGVFGLVKPRLLWPRGISAHLDDSQIEAILAHELSHVGRYDNLIAAVQMGVQAVFWFHPLVWWIGTRVVDERERACDEDVLQAGSKPETYAESILRTCRFSIESPLTCVAGVTGADLKRRIETIVNHRDAAQLSAARKMLLAIAGTAAVVGPVAMGVMTAPRISAQVDTLRVGERNFEVASIKRNEGAENRVALMTQPGGRVTATNVPLSMLIRFSYQLQDFQIVGGPDWMESNRFDVVAKAEGDIPLAGPGTVGPVQLMMRSLLAERFKFAAHMEKRDMPIYALVPARSDGRLGPQLTRSTVNCGAIMAARGRQGPPPPPPPGERMQCGFRIGPGRMTGGGFPLSQLATSLSSFVQRIVVDKTGLEGDYDIDLTYTPDQMTMGPLKTPGAPNPPLTDASGPSLFTALQEQLGLKLESTRGQVDVLVIDRVDVPSPD
jgi:bla regulator protein BlaR1